MRKGFLFSKILAFLRERERKNVSRHIRVQWSPEEDMESLRAEIKHLSAV